MTKDILLSLKGLQMEYAEDSDAVETITPASYYRKGGSHYIVYDEMTEGFTETTRNIIRFQDSYLEVFKRGLINVRMVFEKSNFGNCKWHRCHIYYPKLWYSYKTKWEVIDLYKE